MEHLWSYFLNPFTTTPERTALVVDGREFSYADLGAGALRVSSALRELPIEGPFVGLLAARSFGAYAGILGIQHAGMAYVPLGPQLPVARLKQIMGSAGLQVIVTDAQHHAQALELAVELDGIVRVVLAKETDPETLRESIPEAILGEYAYMLFTSGSTGIPKGVPIRHANVITYVTHIRALLEPTADDRFSQLFELTFDLSVHDMFLCWAAGASLHVVPKEQLMAPAKFIKEQRLSFWFSVPSSAILLDRFRMLRADAFPDLRVSLFCGEALPTATALKWKAAAPNSRVLNLYGPTEATIAITAYELIDDHPKERHGVMCIGRHYPGNTALLVDENGRSAERGELLLSGPQVTDAYWADPIRSAQAFIIPDGTSTLHYRTGDLMERDTDGDLFFIGRIDHQVKVRGHRVELGEVDHVLKQVSDAAFAYTVAHPVRDGMVQGLHAFLPTGLKMTTERILEACADRLPEYMVPSGLHYTDDIPFNSSGKADVRALAARLQNAS